MWTVDDGRKIVALPIGLKLRPIAEMPFPNIPRGIAGRLQCFGHRDRIERQRHGGPGSNHTFKGSPMPGDMCRDANASLILAGLQGATCWRADGSSSVEIGEPHSFGRQLVDVRRINEIIAVTTNILPSHIVNENQDDVGTVGSAELRSGECQDDGSVEPLSRNSHGNLSKQGGGGSPKNGGLQNPFWFPPLRPQDPGDSVDLFSI